MRRVTPRAQSMTGTPLLLGCRSGAGLAELGFARRRRLRRAVVRMRVRVVRGGMSPSKSGAGTGAGTGAGCRGRIGQRWLDPRGRSRPVPGRSSGWLDQVGFDAWKGRLRRRGGRRGRAQELDAQADQAQRRGANDEHAQPRAGRRSRCIDSLTGQAAQGGAGAAVRLVDRMPASSRSATGGIPEIERWAPDGLGGGGAPASSTAPWNVSDQITRTPCPLANGSSAAARCHAPSGTGRRDRAASRGRSPPQNSAGRSGFTDRGGGYSPAPMACSMV